MSNRCVISKIEGVEYLPFFESFKLIDIEKKDTTYSYTFERLVIVANNSKTRIENLKIYSNMLIDNKNIIKELKKQYTHYFI
jgi:hypothetical protein